MTITSLLPNQADLPSPNPSPSYWLSQPSPLLHGHRTTPELPPSADVIVIGSGITGAFAAKALKEGWARDRSVVMLEAREVCSGATGRNGGHCQPSLFSRLAHICQFELRNFAHVRALVEDNAVQCGWRTFVGSNGMFSPDYIAQGRRRLDQLERDYPDIRAEMDFFLPSDPRFAEQHMPNAVAVELQYNAATLWPYRLVAWMLEQLVKDFGSAATGRSFNLQTNTPAVHLQQLPRDGWVVHTPRGQITAPQVLLATNGYTSRLLPSFTNVIVPTQGQVAALLPKLPATNEAVTLGHTYGFWGHEPGESAMPTTVASRDDYLAQSQLGRREIIFGGGRRFSARQGWGVSDDSSVDPHVSRFLRNDLVNGQTLDLRAWSEVDPTAEQEMEATAEWTGIMGYSRDWQPWVGPVPGAMGGGRGGLWVCGGYSGHGMPVAPLSARAVVEMMGGSTLDEVDLPPEFYVGEGSARCVGVFEGARLTL